MFATPKLPLVFAITKFVPSNVRLASAFIASAPVAVRTLLLEPFVIKSDTSTDTVGDAVSPLLFAKSIPVPAVSVAT